MGRSDADRPVLPFLSRLVQDLEYGDGRRQCVHFTLAQSSFQAPYAWPECAAVAPRFAMRPRKPASPDDYDGLLAARSRIVQGQSAEKSVHKGWLPIGSRRPNPRGP